MISLKLFLSFEISFLLLTLLDREPFFWTSSKHTGVIGKRGNKPGKGLPGPGTVKGNHSSKTKKCRHQTVLKWRIAETIASGFSFGKLEVPIIPVFQIGNTDE